ncbi:unnamed protein product [Acanthoscelides obtectus]|uniref:Uncharacterized protein n=1 Tax=Acanthoscelides obtectus TaxID=200917 RepID=A0A9P0P283_ACAOB|nr:unnamed protein product [Acanthoscelides obtectus]CAK1623493.1 hypothetical protein AOBTE_LOCUS2035 [Acanthoscelides obtectus]
MEFAVVRSIPRSLADMEYSGRYCIYSTLALGGGSTMVELFDLSQTVTFVFESLVPDNYTQSREIEQSDISTNNFRNAVVEKLLKFEDGYTYDRTCPVKVNLRAHVLLKLYCKARENRRYCKGCYNEKQDGLIEKVKKICVIMNHIVDPRHTNCMRRIQKGTQRV